MRLQRICSLSTLAIALGAAQIGLKAEAKGEAPDLKEVYGLIREHPGGLSEAEVNRRAVHGLLTEFGSAVTLLSKSEPGSTPATGPVLTQTNVFDGDIAYLRVRRVDGVLAKAVADAADKLRNTNQMRGVVLDLRYATGDDYAAAAATADLFMKRARPLMDWGTGVVNSKDKTEPINGPVTVLVNRQTAGAAEALAAVLRQSAAALLLGSKTAGQAMVTQEFPLQNGDRLRIGTNPIKLGDGSPIAATGLSPDIRVELSPEEERAYYDDAFKEIARSNIAARTPTLASGAVNETNRTIRRPRFNEAELVRERKEGILPDAEGLLGKDLEAETPWVRDPALARALDVLKGLAVVRRAHS